MNKDIYKAIRIVITENVGNMSNDEIESLIRELEVELMERSFLNEECA